MALTMDVRRFADAGVLAAVADRAVATTLVTAEGRALTEITLQVQNRAQPFLKVALPAGATIVSVEVAGETAKPMVGADGTRVPLLRPGFRPNGSYQVSFVYMQPARRFFAKATSKWRCPEWISRSASSSGRCSCRSCTPSEPSTATSSIAARSRPRSRPAGRRLASGAGVGVEGGLHESVTVTGRCTCG